MTKKWVIPDIHGCVRTLETIIEKQIMPNKNDLLVFLGDYIDRGPDSKGVIDIITDLQNNEYNVVALKGNHEDYCVKAHFEDKKKRGFLGIRSKTKVQKEWEMHGGVQTLESFNAEWPRDIPEKYIRWMQDLPYYHIVDEFVIVHAGLNFKEEDPFTDTQSMMWIRDFKVDSEKIDNRKVIHGHVPVNLEFIDLSIKSSEYKFIDLDNGIYFDDRAGYGSLIALELNSMEYAQQSLMDEINYKRR